MSTVLMSKFLGSSANDLVSTVPDDNTGNAGEHSFCSLECMPPESELDFVVNNVKVVNSPDRILFKDALMEIKGFRKSTSYITENVDDVLNSEDKYEGNQEDEMQRNDIAGRHDDRKKSSRELIAGIEQIYAHESKGLKLKIKLEVCHYYTSSYSSVLSEASNSCSGVKDIISLHGSDGGKSAQLEAANLASKLEDFSNLSSEVTKYSSSSRNRDGAVELQLPPRLRQASYRNPLHLNSLPRDSELPPGCFHRLMTQKLRARDFVVKLWKRSVICCGKAKLKCPACCLLVPNNESMFRCEDWASSLLHKFWSKWGKTIFCRRMLASTST
eukprot:Gb_06240 [translate_table: standard]